MKVTVPRTIKQATEALNGLDDLVTATEWERAAIVWAFTYETTRGGKPGSRVNARTGALTVNEFAKLGIHGLRKRETVSAARQMWEYAIINHGAADVQPGERVELPDAPWPNRQDEAGQKRYTEQDSGAFARAMQRGKVDAEAFAQDIDAATAAAIVGRLAEDRPGLIADAVAQAPDAARAIARNTTAREMVEDEGISVRAKTPAELAAESKAMRKNRHDTHKAFGDDQVVSYLNGAASDIGHAIFAAEEWGVDDTEGEQRALARIKHLLRVYEQKADITDADTAFLAEHGITLTEEA